jgi:hypothetical protein
LRAQYLLHAIKIVVMPIALFASFGYAQTTSPTNCVIAAGSNIVTCTTSNAPTGTFSTNTFTLTGGTTGSGFSCGPVTPDTQSVQLGSATQPVSAVCTGATGYQWYLGRRTSGGILITGATGASYTPPSNQVGTSTYYVTATKGTEIADSITGGTVTVQQLPTGCPSGEPRITTAFGTSVQRTDNDGFRDGSPTGPGRIFVTQITVSASDTTIGRQLLPNFYFYYNDNSTFSERTITLSRNCGDFGATSTFLGRDISGSVSFVTQGDARGSTTVPTLTPGVWFINLRSETCPTGVVCSFGAGWRASTF